MNKKTHEQYVEELKIKNPNLQVIGIYVDAKTNIKHKCLKHNVCWDTTPSRALQGVGCEKCHIEKIVRSKTRTHEDYVEQLRRVNPDIVPLEKFKTINDSILHYCKKHDVKWNAIPDNVLRGHGCKECGNEKIADKNKKSYSEYIEELHSKFPEIDCIGDYKNYTSAVLHKCTICNHKWSTAPINIIKGVGCPKCNHHLQRNTEQYIKELQQINPQIELVGEFINMNTYASHRCKIHDYIWDVVPSSIMRGTGCPICGKEKQVKARTKTPEIFRKELHAISPDIVCLQEYTKALEKINVKCLKCGHKWDTLPINLLRGSKCPNCNKSNGENIIYDWLMDNGIEFIPQKRFENCRDKRTLPFDFYLPKYNTCIEYDGEQHDRPIDWFGGIRKFEYLKKHDNIKNQYCKDNNINLLRISYKDDIQLKLNSLFI